MANMALNIEQRIGQKLTNEQYLLWQYTLLQFGEPTKIEPFTYQGGLNAGELVTYDVNKAYVLYNLYIDGENSAASYPQAAIRNLANVAIMYISNPIPYWDATAAGVRYVGAALEVHYFLLSCFSFNASTRIRFIGYKITK